MWKPHPAPLGTECLSLTSCLRLQAQVICGTAIRPLMSCLRLKPEVNGVRIGFKPNSFKNNSL